MDKSWMHEIDRTSTRYSEGVKQFINMACGHADQVGRIKCLCRKCTNRYYHHINAVETHLIVNRFYLNYTEWIFHGEEDPFFKHVQVEHNDDNSQAEDIDDIREMLDDIYRGTFPDANIGESSTSPGPSNNDYKARPFDQLWQDAQRELYPGCKKFSKLSFCMKLLHIKTLCNWSDKSFDLMIDLIMQALPNGESLPKSYYEAKQFRRDLGSSYELIHVYKNVCTLF